MGSLGARLRSAARLGGTDMSWGGYIVPRGPTGHVARGTPGLAMRALTMVGNGAVRSIDCLPPVTLGPKQTHALCLGRRKESPTLSSGALTSLSYR